MPKLIPPVRFSATGGLQIYIVPEAGHYLIEAAGAQGGGDPGAPGGMGAFLRGVFHLAAGDLIHLVVGRQGLPGTNPGLPMDEVSAFTREANGEYAALLRGGGGGGGTFVWKGTLNGSLPTWPLLAAGGGGGGGNQPGGHGLVTIDATRGTGPGGRNGHGGSSDLGVFYYSGGGGAGWISRGANGAGPTYCQGGTQWEGGAGAGFGGYFGGHGGYGGGGGGSFFGGGSGGGGGYSGGGGGGGRTGVSGGGGGSYNGGREQQNAPGVQAGDGFVSLALLPVSVTIQGPGTSARPHDLSEQKAPDQSSTATLLPPTFLPSSRWQYFPY